MTVRHENTWLERIALQRSSREAQYWLGYRHGKGLAGDDLTNHEPVLRLELSMFEAPSTARAFALGALRGYREATREP